MAKAWTNPTLFCPLSLLTFFLQSGMPILTIYNATNPPHLLRSPAKPSEHSEHIVPFPITPAWIRSHKIPWNVVMIFSFGAYFGHHVDRTVLRKGRGNTIRPGKRCMSHFFNYLQTIWNWNLSALSLNWWVTEISLRTGRTSEGTAWSSSVIHKFCHNWTCLGFARLVCCFLLEVSKHSLSR